MEEYGVKCPVCNSVLEASEATPFCPPHRDKWLKSPERGEVDWTSDDSYNTFSLIFTARTKDEEGLS